MAKKGKPEPQALTIQARYLEAVSFECECGCRVEIQHSNGPKGEEIVCPCCGDAIPDAFKVWKAFDALGWAVRKGESVRYRLRAPAGTL